MAENEKRFLNYENSLSIYRSKTAMIAGVLYFSQGYQSTPVIGFQFAEVNDPNAEQKTFNWDTEQKVWYFPTYDKCWELVKKLSKWKAIIANLRQQNVTNNDDISTRFKEYAEKNKISNPVKKKSMYLSARYYNEYFFTISLVGQNIKCSVSLYEDELDMLIKYLSDFVTNYHVLSLQHRIMTISRGMSKGGNGSSRDDESGSKSSGGRGGKSSSYNKNSKPNDSFDDSDIPSTGDAVDSLLQGGSLDDLMKGVSEDIPF